ncbi:MAG: formimidoylglutamate deiminase, partial [Planctomycetota bacterium]
MSSLKEWYAPFALLPTGWAADVRLLVDDGGNIVATELLDDGETLPPQSAHLGGPVIPGFPNVHSHAFQRGMAGLAEWRATEADSFWSWRETMYRFVGLLEPDDILAIAEFLYCELLTCGYTSVGEFHYLHRDTQGSPFDDPAELSHAMLRAGEASGIGVTLLPTLYTHGGCGNQPLQPAQQRFCTSGKDILRIYEAVRSTWGASQRHRVGIAAHSLRAIDPADFKMLLAEVERIDP